MKSELSRGAQAAEILAPYRRTGDSLDFLSSILSAFDPEGYWQPDKTKLPPGAKVDLGRFLEPAECERVQTDLGRYLEQAETETEEQGPMSLFPLDKMLRLALSYKNRFETHFLAHPGHVYGRLAQPFPLLKIAKDYALPAPGQANRTRQYEFWLSLVPQQYVIAEIFLLESEYVITEVDEFLTENDGQYYSAVSGHNLNPPPSKYANKDFRDSIYAFLDDICIKLRVDEFFRLRELVRTRDMEGIRNLFKTSNAYQQEAGWRSFEQFWNCPAMAFGRDLAAIL